jgi:uncharacterized membrane protein
VIEEALVMEAFGLTPVFAITSGLAVLGAVLVQRRSRRRAEEARKALRPLPVRVRREGR